MSEKSAQPQKTRKVTLTRAQIAEMGPDAFQSLLLKATKIEAKCVVLRPDGSVKYDDPSLAGTYGEEHLEASRL